MSVIQLLVRTACFIAETIGHREEGEQQYGS